MKRDPLAATLEEAIASATHEPFARATLEPLAGGCIHRAYRIDGRAGDAARRYFAKVNGASAAAMFAAEAEGLDALRAGNAVRVPRTVTHGADGDTAWIVLEWLDLQPLAGGAARRLGELLARLHGQPRERFGWASDNFIGASPQRNGWSDDWLAFWQDRRLHAQLRIAAAKRLPTRMIDRGERLVADCEVFFRNHAVAPSLLHGDLWSGNVAGLAEGEPVLFDPAVYVGDREADVAMTELFGGFPADFMAAYRERAPLADGYATRRELYNLYHRLNHANLFAGGYVRDSEQAIERLLAEIR